MVKVGTIKKKKSGDKFYNILGMRKHFNEN